MAMFSKLDKEILITLIVIIFALLLVIFMIYQSAVGSSPKVNNLTGGVNTEINK